MTDEFMLAQYAAKLGFLQECLDERGWSTKLLERDENLPISVLSVAAPRDPNGRERKITFAFVPLDYDDLDYISLLQFYSPLPITMDPKYVDQLDILFGVLNPGLAIGHFGHKDNEIFMRHVYTTSQTELVDKDMFIETVLLFFSMQSASSAAIEAVATGKQTAGEVLRLLKLLPDSRQHIVSPAEVPLIDHAKAYFEAAGWTYEPVRDSAITAVFEGDSGTFRCFAQVREEERQFIFYAVSPLPAPEDKLQDMMVFTTLANYGMFVGNFELDLEDGEIRFKTSIALGFETMSANLIAPLILAGVIVMDRYYPAIRATIEGRMSPEDAVASVENIVLGDDSD